MVQLADLFSVPEMGLICNVADYFERNHIDYHPEILFRDVKVSIRCNIQSIYLRCILKKKYFSSVINIIYCRIL